MRLVTNVVGMWNQKETSDFLQDITMTFLLTRQMNISLKNFIINEK